MFTDILSVDTTLHDFVHAQFKTPEYHNLRFYFEFAQNFNHFYIQSSHLILGLAYITLQF